MYLEAALYDINPCSGFGQIHIERDLANFFQLVPIRHLATGTDGIV